tara:strand:+ start:2669 stop:3037 length:369 start_codon:yes stop_codon:yes gene_type:complete
MTNYTIYNTSSGVIETCGTTNATIEQIILQSGQSIIEGIYEVEKYKIISGSAVEQSIDFWGQIRIERNVLLSESDWTQIADTPLSDSKKAEWVTYRQSLRDLPADNSSAATIDAVTFPTQPS